MVLEERISDHQKGAPLNEVGEGGRGEGGGGKFRLQGSAAGHLK